MMINQLVLTVYLVCMSMVPWGSDDFECNSESDNTFK